MTTLGALERDVMERLWQSPAPMSVRQVLDALTDRTLAYTTVMTVLDRLHQKELVTRARDGRAYHYSPVADRETLAAELMRTALEEAGPARTAALVQFTEHVTSEEAAAMQAALSRITAKS